MSKRVRTSNSTLDDWIVVKKDKANEKIRRGSWATIGSDLLIYKSDEIEHRPRIAGFDIDGTIITTKSGNVFSTDEFDWRFLYSHVPSKLEEMHKSGYKVVFFSNQKGIQLGKQCPDAFKRKVEAICEQLSVPAQVFVSLGSLQYRKPYVGMWDYMEISENDDVIISRKDSVYVGDAAGRTASTERKKKDHSSADRLFAMNVGIKFCTPEEFFLNQKSVEPFCMPLFDPRELLKSDKSLLEPADTPLPSEKKEIILLVGFPGCGKSKFAADIEKKYGYGVVNRDTLKTWQKCVGNAKVYLERGQSVVVDNTNGDFESRKRYCDLAKILKVECRCFIFACCMEQAAHHVKYRSIIGTDSYHEKVGIMVLRMFDSKYKEPQLNEGFSSIVKVNFVPDFAAEEQRRVYSMFLCDS